MIRKITFKNTNVSLLQINTDAPLQIETSDNLTFINNMILTPVGDNLDKNLFILSGNFTNSLIEINSSCTLQSNPTFLCAIPINLNLNSTDTLILLGDFKNTSGIKVITPSTIVSGTSVQLENLNLVIQYTSPSENPLNIVGDFTHCSTFINSSSSINLNGTMGELLVEPAVYDIILNLVPGSTVDDVKAFSKILVTGDRASVDALLSNTTEGLNNIIVLYNTFVVNFLNGVGVIPLEINSIGKYKISATVMDETNENPLSQSVNIEIL